MVKKYRYSYQGSESDNEVSGTKGSHITTYYREFDLRLARSWSFDPSYVSWESPYVLNRNSPLGFVDPMGDLPKWLGGKGGKRHRATTKARGQFNKHDGVKGLINKLRALFGKRPLGAPAGRRKNQGWSAPKDGDWTPGNVEAEGSPMDRTMAVNLFNKVGSRGTITSVEVRGNASQPLTSFSITGGTSQANQKTLFASNGLQNIDPRGSLNAITTDEYGNSPYSLGDFEARSGFLPFLNSLPTIVQLMRGPFSLMFGDKADEYRNGSILANSLWMQNAFNHKPLLTGDIWSLKFRAFSPLGGDVSFTFRYKSKVWRSYNTFNDPDQRGNTPDRPNLLFRILYGY